ncbi:Uncharacterised protein [Bartonella grahamii]|uniref:Uncharacterized protein n=1 Tax=Bartonella grahamii TaxID=33045 RepID=A0A336NF79_BARGR|nr:Uncharacterised protein [Bartonella grahamii]
MSTIYDWSLTASENGGADALINWSEGQHPNTVNNSARFMMQRIVSSIYRIRAACLKGLLRLIITKRRA